MTKEELIGKLHMIYAGDRNALEEMVGYYDGLKEVVELLKKENQKYKEVIDKTKMRISAIIKKYQQKIDNEIDMGSQGDHFKICRYEENIKILKDILKEVE